MTRLFTFVGVDPGPITGIVAIPLVDGRINGAGEALQITYTGARRALEKLYDGAGPTTLIQVERFVVGHRASRSSNAGAGQITRDLVGELQAAFPRNVELRNASDVKAWATDVRLERAGLADITKGMRHARDAARHALYAACKAGELPDPMSRKA